MKTKETRLRRIQHLAHEIMDEMNFQENHGQFETIRSVIDNLSRAIGDLADPLGEFSLDYIEEKVGKAHYQLFNEKKKGHRVPSNK
ncbi:hypothetical protein JOC86_000052 [Bacillus pakistanensis]|uniref:Group-specific protein n=1 Tax=Rossellomorea pakistanensis TaxID=992288 RepID=A0ABS2N6T4_9BACI|nr:hypothetical protein [Bacillus pakistanensis]MBM7583515.1 hypothetical protein [Bacillus pakistanensis]